MTELEQRIEVLRDALKFAIAIIGHPDDQGTKYLQQVLADTEPQNSP